MTATDIHALVGAYALDAVDDLERVAFERHVTECESCRIELDELRETVCRLADDAWSVPPPRLREQVLAEVGRTRQLPPARKPRPDRRVESWRRWATAAAAAVVLAAGTGVSVWQVQEQRVQDQSVLAEQAQRREARTRQILAAPDLVVRTAPVVGGGKVTVASSAQYDAGVMMLGADGPPANGRVFELWTLRGRTATKAGLLDPGVGSAVRVIDGLPGNDGFGVSVEPPGGSPQPTQIVANVTLT
ncbi:anti-sigma factor [Mangrovihabitans endophyticus]|uniref:Regulator of SigK n=1 Tax=Mangrovihabitans endophyticus TaxID=1751298 RepID=A0A8J3FRQ3_9ACTN|nr:anti-sigma factor [Mangrovihabitans endophyticus]GGL18319.1 hypothetical protein GCM10012284_61160 [Mangrovihabitans endophyticus]